MKTNIKTLFLLAYDMHMNLRIVQRNIDEPYTIFETLTEAGKHWDKMKLIIYIFIDWKWK